jgi:hypothetical protein
VTDIRKEFIKSWLLWFKNSVIHIIDRLIEDMDTEDTPERIANYIVERIEQELGTLERGLKNGNIQ